jgi:hypothetical protein
MHAVRSPIIEVNVRHLPFYALKSHRASLRMVPSGGTVRLGPFPSSANTPGRVVMQLFRMNFSSSGLLDLTISRGLDGAVTRQQGHLTVVFLRELIVALHDMLCAHLASMSISPLPAEA